MQVVRQGPRERCAHLVRCSALAQNKYLSRHDKALKVLSYEMLHDLGLIDEIPPWYSPVNPKPVYQSDDVQAYWDVPVFVDHQEMRSNRVDALFVNHKSKQVTTLGMSCPWVNNTENKSEEKTFKYGLLRWELKQQFPGYEVQQHIIITDALGGWPREMDTTMHEIVGSRSREVLRKMQKALLSGTLNIAR